MTVDVAIVGAGPAGAWAAGTLAAAGARVTIFDASHPREKPCGGGLTGRALDLIRGVLAEGFCTGVVAETARFEADASALTPTVALAHHALTPQSALVIVSRSAFDRLLLDHALARGARLISERVTDVTMDAGGASVTTSGGRYRTSHLIGADGAASLVRKRLSTPFGRRQISIATGYFVHGVSSRDIAIRCIAEPAGYLWSFPRPDHLAVGICAQADTAPTGRPLREIVRAWIARSVTAPDTRLVTYTWPIPSLSIADLASNNVTGRRWMLVGDAAGLVDPLTREGIFFALRSAELASASILHEGTDPHIGYAMRLDDEIYPELRRAAGVTARFFTPAFSALLLRALDESSEIRRVAGDLIAGRQTYHGLRRRLLGTGEFRLAARFLGTSIRAIWPRNRPAPEPSHRDVTH